jgi:CheY-like chemotaxis protein
VDAFHLANSAIDFESGQGSAELASTHLAEWRVKCCNIGGGAGRTMAPPMANIVTLNNPVKFHVWLVEDSEADELLMREALKLEGLLCEYQVSLDGEKAIEFIEELDVDETRPRPDLVLLDLNLPRKGGARVLERIRQSLDCAQVPVIIVTSSDSPSDKAQASRLGATRYFQKSLDLAEFMKLGSLAREVLGESQRPARATNGSRS